MYCLSFLEVLPTLDDHFKLSLSHSSALRMAFLMYLLTLPSPPCKLRRHILHLSFFLLPRKGRLHKEAMPE